MEVPDVESGAVDIIDNTFRILLECKEKGEVLRKHLSPSIYRVPSVLRDVSPSSFNPRMVSIGPLHRQDENLRRFEVQKMAYLHNLLSRCSRVPEQMLRACTEKVVHSIERIKACYAESTTYSDSELAKMMVIDACFILEFIQTLLDSSFENNWVISQHLAYDMLQIENQIPFFVLENIFECTVLASGIMKEEWASLTKHIEVLLYFYVFFKGNRVVPPASTHDHILGFVHKYYQPLEAMPSVPISAIKSHSAMELDRAAMNFKPNENQNWALAMKLKLPLPLFSWFPNFMIIPQLSWFRRPTLSVPKLRIGDSTEFIFRNLIIYEQFSNVKKYVTSYTYAMDMLIDTPQDVAVLVKSKVLHHYLGLNEDAANMINKLSKFVILDKFFYGSQWEEMDAYYNSYWPHTIAGLKRTYFNNPWSIIAAFLLFSLTIVQTIFTIKAA